MKKLIIAIFIVCFAFSAGKSQIGIRAGLNMANQLSAFSWDEISKSFTANNLTGYQIGVVYQFMSRPRILGFEIGAMLSQKGYSFQTEENATGYREINFVEIPINLRVNIPLGIISIYGFAGGYGAYALNGKNVIESSTKEINKISYPVFYDHLDYGYNIGAGLELFKKVQVSAVWSQGLKDTAINSDDASINRVLSVMLTYLF